MTVAIWVYNMVLSSSVESSNTMALPLNWLFPWLGGEVWHSPPSFSVNPVISSAQRTYLACWECDSAHLTSVLRVIWCYVERWPQLAWLVLFWKRKALGIFFQRQKGQYKHKSWTPINSPCKHSSKASACLLPSASEMTGRFLTALGSAFSPMPMRAGAAAPCQIRNTEKPNWTPISYNVLGCSPPIVSRYRICLE